jgi:hypothetical protein
LHLDKVDFIKMDIEGAERQALSGAVRSIARFRPRMAIELEHRKEDADELPRLVHGLWPAAALHMGPCDLLQSDTFRRLQPEVLFVSF